MLEEIESVKSSSEILTELFSAFNAKPPEDGAVYGKSRKKSKKTKKAKKKSKSKKHKKKRTSSSDDDSSSEEEDFPDRKPNLELTTDSVPSALDQLLGNILNPQLGTSPKSDTSRDFLNPARVNIKVEPLDRVRIKSERVEGALEKSKNNGDEWELPHVKQEKEMLQAVFSEPPLPDEQPTSEKTKTKSLVLPSLKNSSVFQETLRAVEEQEKQMEALKAKYEEGELTNSSKSSSDEEVPNGKEDSSKERKRSSRKRSHSKTDRHSDRKRHRRSDSHSKHRSRSRERKRGSSRERHVPYYGERNRGSTGSRSRDDHHSRSSSSRDHRESSRDRRKPSSSSSREKHDSKSRDHHRDRSRSRTRQKSSERPSERSHTRDRDEDGNKIDKKRLLAIAKKNAVKLVASGIVSADNLKSITRGGKTVNELTEYCKKLSKKEAGEEISDVESLSSDSDDPSFHHPFQVRDRPNSIVMNIRNSISLPTRSFQEKAVEQSKVLRLQFPVSSGSTHRANENEWVPVEPAPAKPVAARTGASTDPLALMPPPPQPPLPPMPPPDTPLSAVPPPLPAVPVFPVIQPAAAVQEETAVPDISAIVSKRLDALRALQEDPQNRSAKVQVSRTERQLEHWVKSESRKPRTAKMESGEFTGSTGARLLTPRQLSSGQQAWAKKDQLIKANPVTGGMGMALLQKMGWQPGEGLGKNKEGSLEPLRLEVKTDKKGLVAFDETSWGSKTPSHVGPVLPTVKTLDGKHPVSLLNEFAARRRWPAPKFELAFECGPDHKKNFLFKVTVNGSEYKPSVASVNKKQAKAECAAICLRALGVISAVPEESGP